MFRLMMAVGVVGIAAILYMLWRHEAAEGTPSMETKKDTSTGASTEAAVAELLRRQDLLADWVPCEPLTELQVADGPDAPHLVYESGMVVDTPPIWSSAARDRFGPSHAEIRAQAGLEPRERLTGFGIGGYWWRHRTMDGAWMILHAPPGRRAVFETGTSAPLTRDQVSDANLLQNRAIDELALILNAPTKH